MYFDDLTEYSYSTIREEKRKTIGVASDTIFLNVGWLDREHDFPKGDVDPRIIPQLLAISEDCFTLWRGYHLCDVCPKRQSLDFTFRNTLRAQGRDVALGSRDIYVKHRDVVFVAPDLILHYISEHGYLPPEPFLEAVLDYAS